MTHPTAYGRGWNDAIEGLKDHSQAEDPEYPSTDRVRYHAGYHAGKLYVNGDSAEPVDNELVEEASTAQSATHSLVDKMANDIQKTREVILKHFVEDPGFLATFGSDFTPEFGDISMYTNEDPNFTNFAPLDIVNIRVEHRIIIRRNEYLEKDRKVETIKRLRKELVDASNRRNNTRITEIRKELNFLEQSLSENDLRITENGDLESV